MKTFDTYEAFAAAYRELFRLAMQYAPDQVGSRHYTDQMAEMADAYPAWAEQAENEQG